MPMTLKNAATRRCTSTNCTCRPSACRAVAQLRSVPAAEKSMRISRAHEIQASLVLQLPSSVLWEDTVQTMGRMGVTTFVEIGPGTVLTGLIRRILPEANLLNVNDPKSLDATLKAVS